MANNPKPQHPYIDDAVADAIEYVVTMEHVHSPQDVRKVVQRGARRVAGHYGLRQAERRWVVGTVCHRLGV